MKYLCTVWGGILLCWGLIAQGDSVLLTKNFKFKDGIYLHLESFQNNQPDYAWTEIKTNLFTNPQTFITQIDYIALKETNGKKQALNLNEIWGISLDGIPYLRLPKGAIDNSLTNFAGLQVRGKICYFDYERVEMQDILMPVYNPLTKKPFRAAYIQRELPVLYQKMMDFYTGEIKDFNTENFLEWIEDDSQLWKAVNILTEEEAQKKLFKSLLIYDDRHEVYVRG